MTITTFEEMDSAEKVILTFDFAAELSVGETLSGTPTVTLRAVNGSDPSPSTILNGAAGFDATQTKVMQPVQGGIAGVKYLVKVISDTSNPNKRLALYAILPVTGG